MINIILGTRAQLIKMAPVMREMERRSVPFKLILSGQHKDTIQELINDFEINEKPEYIYNGDEMTGIISMAAWFIRCLYDVVFNKHKFPYLNQTNKPIIIIHGDTFSTLLGALIGKFYNGTIVHIESGLRSFNILHPFPEEITRILTFYFTDIAFCPGDWASKNMKKYKLQNINTIHNTLLDSINCVLNFRIHKKTSVVNYCVCSIHRFENVFFKKRLLHIINLIEDVANTYHVVLIMHPTTKKNLIKFGLFERLDKNNSIELKPRTGYKEFIHLLYNSKFVITDGGSNQEELSYMGKPVLLMRKVTERQNGLGRNVKICNYEKNIVDEFIKNLESYSFSCEPTTLSPSPSNIIVDKLIPN